MRLVSSGLFMTPIQCFGSGSGTALILGGWIRILIQEANNDPKNRKKGRNFKVWSAKYSLLELGRSHGGLGISKLKFLIKKT